MDHVIVMVIIQVDQYLVVATQITPADQCRAAVTLIILVGQYRVHVIQIHQVEVFHVVVTLILLQRLQLVLVTTTFRVVVIVT